MKSSIQQERIKLRSAGEYKENSFELMSRRIKTLTFGPCCSVRCVDILAPYSIQDSSVAQIRNLVQLVSRDILNLIPVQGSFSTGRWDFKACHSSRIISLDGLYYRTKSSGFC